MLQSSIFDGNLDYRGAIMDEQALQGKNDGYLLPDAPHDQEQQDHGSCFHDNLIIDRAHLLHDFPHLYPDGVAYVHHH